MRWSWRWTFAVLALSCAATLTACGGGGGGSSSSSSAGGSGSAGACKPAHPGLHTMSGGTLSVAVYSYPPYGYQQGDKVAGVDGDVINRIAAMECMKVKPVPGAASAMIPDVQSGRADTCIGDWYRTEPRAKIVLLSAPVYKDQMVLVSNSGVSQVSQLKGKQVGSVLGFLWDDDLKKLLGGNMKFYPTDQAAYADLKAGRIQVVVDTPGAAEFEMKTEHISGYDYKVAAPDPAVAATVHPGQATFPVNKSNPDLHRAIDEDIAKLHSDGTIKRILVSHGFPASAAQTGPPRLLGA